MGRIASRLDGPDVQSPLEVMCNQALDIDAACRGAFWDAIGRAMDQEISEVIASRNSDCDRDGNRVHGSFSLY